jgi:tRNA (guanine-N(7)-)-methyltransferase
LTLVYTHNNTPYYLHSKFNPEKESLKILQAKNLSADHIVVLGLGLGYHLEKIMETKDPLSRVLLVEPDLELVGHSLHTFRWHKFLDRKDFFYVLGTDLGHLAETLHVFISMAEFEKVEFIELSSETRILSVFFTKAKETLDAEIKSHLYDFKTHLAESYMVPRNILRNLYWILKSRPITHLKNYFPGTPGFIISAGPSLDKNVLHLKKIRNRGVFITVDTALKPLLKRSLQPHFTAIGDPSHKNYLHLQGTETRLQHFIAAEAGIASQVFKDFQGKIFALSIGKPIVRIIEENSEPLGEIEAWGSVISIALDFAVYIGLNPIIFVGQDFAFTDTRNHCRGTSWEEKKIEYSRSLDDLQRFETQSIAGNRKINETEDIYGNKTFTSERLELYKNYLARLLTRYPDVKFINATQGGIFSEIPHMPLYQAIKKFVYGKRTINFNRIRQKPTLNKRNNINRLLDFLSQTKEFFENYLTTIKEALTFLENNNDFAPAAAFPRLRQLEQLYQHLYSNIRYGEILEMWSAAPIYYFLKEYKRLRNQELNETIIRKSFEIYETYFRNIQPLVEDIIKHFKRSSGQLAKLESTSAYGNWLIRLREGQTCTFSPQNAYMLEAVKLRELLFTLPELEREFPGIFENSSLPLVLEVGCYMGHTVIELAENNPGINVLGIDLKYKRVVKSTKKIKQTKLTNAKIALCDVMELLPILPEHSLYGMFIFFPDPWTKDRHEKYRYLDEDFFNLASSRLSDDGFIWLKTDQKKYFEEITAAAKQYNFSVIPQLPGKIAQREYRTRFEEMFMKKRIPYYQLILSR